MLIALTSNIVNLLNELKVLSGLVIYTRKLQELIYMYIKSLLFSEESNSDSDTNFQKINNPTIYITEAEPFKGPILDYINFNDESLMKPKTYFTSVFADKFEYSSEILINISECTDLSMDNICINLFQEIYIRLCTDIPQWDPQESPINIIATQCSVPIVHNLLTMMCDPDKLQLLTEKTNRALTKLSLDIPVGPPSLSMISKFVSINGNVGGIMLYDDLVATNKPVRIDSKEIKTGVFIYFIYQVKQIIIVFLKSILSLIIQLHIVINGLIYCESTKIKFSKYYDKFLKKYSKDCVHNYLYYNSSSECKLIKDKLKEDKVVTKLKENNLSLIYIVSNVTVPISISWYKLHIPIIICNPFRYFFILLHHSYQSLNQIINKSTPSLDGVSNFENNFNNSRSTNGLIQVKNQECPFSIDSTNNIQFKNIYIDGLNTTEFTKNIFVDLPWEVFNTNLYLLMDYIIKTVL